MDIVKFLFDFFSDSFKEILVTVCTTYIISKIDDKKKNLSARKVDGSNSDK